MIEAQGTRTAHMRLGPEGQRAGAKFRLPSVKSPGRWSKMVTSSKQDRLGAKCTKGIGSQFDVGRCEGFSLGGRQSLHHG